MPLNIVGSNFSKVWAEKLTSAVVLKIQEHMIDQMLTVRDVRKLFESVDLDSTGVLNLHEFTHFISKLQVEPPLSPSSMRVLFAVRTLARRLSLVHTQAPMAPVHLRQAFDENHSDYISFFEFCHVVFPDLDIEEMVLHDAPQKVDGSKSAFMQMADGVSTLLSPRRTASSDLAEHKFKVGDRVKHKSRGIGTVIELMEDMRTRIQFDDGEEHRCAQPSIESGAHAFLPIGSSITRPCFGSVRLADLHAQGRAHQGKRQVAARSECSTEAEVAG